MKPYPDRIGPVELAKAASISDAVIAQDIADTERDIAHYRAMGVRLPMINVHVAYVDYLKRLQVAREALRVATT